MRHIVKQGSVGNHALAQAHAHPPADADAATSRWHGLAHKDDLLGNYLLPEQYFLCCYSEIDAGPRGLGFHIEHIENKSQHPARTFDFSNLAASAFSNSGLQHAARQSWEVFGGHASGKQGHPHPVDMARLVSPLQADCASHFVYLSSGEVAPRAQPGTVAHDRADYTITLLNLNSPYRVSLRREWWDELDELLTQHHQQHWSLEHLAQACLLPRGRKLGKVCRNERRPWLGVLT